MGWSGGGYSSSYNEILDAWFRECERFGEMDQKCLQTKREILRKDPGAAEAWAYGSWERQACGGDTQCEVLAGPFMRPVAKMALQSKGRVSVNYGSALPTSYEVTVQGPHGAERSIETRDRRKAAAFGAAAEKLFEKYPSGSIEEDRELMRILMAIFGEG
jgi:hypothetical protein